MSNVYFITGITGFLGGEILRRLAADTDSHFYCLIRRRRGSSVTDRLEKVLRTISLSSCKRIRAVSGELRDPFMGVDKSTYERLGREVTHIIHSAADVRLNQPWEKISRINVEGSSHVIDFARFCCRNNPVFSHLDYVSTCFVAGRRIGLVDEDDLSEDHGFKNTYEQSKYQAERQVRTHWAEIPTIIYRPSIVVGASETGRALPGNAIYPLLQLYNNWKLPVVPLSSNTRLDIVPVDFVAKAMIHLSTKAQHVGRCFHLAAGPDADIRLSDLVKMADREFGKRTMVLPVALWRAIVRPLLQIVKPALFIRTADTFSAFEPYLFEPSPQYRVHETRKALENSGISLPDTPRFLQACFRYARETEFGSHILENNDR